MLICFVADSSLNGLKVFHHNKQLKVPQPFSYRYFEPSSPVSEADSRGKKTNKARQRERRFYCLFPRTVNCPLYQRVTISPGQEKLLKQ